jgi:NADP-dependent 3-hydroxy acid dehydrogenase YdfG
VRPTKIDPGSATVAITGAGRGIGRATAELFAAKGATVCLGDIDADTVAEAAEQIGTNAHPFKLDVTSHDSFSDFLQAAERTAGPIDVLVNNAGIMPAGRFLDESDATTDAILAINIAGPVHGMRLALPGMIERKRGHVVNVASMLGKTELPGLATYVASKHAVVGLSAAVRTELGGTGVTITTILPGVVNTQLSSGITIPLARLIRVEPDDIAKAIVASLDGRPKEVAVPRWMGLYAAARPFIPGRIEQLVRRLVGDDRALADAASEGRAAYAERIAQQRRPTGSD